jgi:hypothetical protein
MAGDLAQLGLKVGKFMRRYPLGWSENYDTAQNLCIAKNA